MACCRCTNRRPVNMRAARRRRIFERTPLLTCIRCAGKNEGPHALVLVPIAGAAPGAPGAMHDACQNARAATASCPPAEVECWSATLDRSLPTRMQWMPHAAHVPRRTFPTRMHMHRTGRPHRWPNPRPPPPAAAPSSARRLAPILWAQQAAVIGRRLLQSPAVHVLQERDWRMILVLIG